MARQQHKNGKKKSLAIVAGIAVFAAVSASAATLGGVDADALGADQAAVTAPIQGGVSVSWDVAIQGGSYVVTGVTMSLVDETESLDGASIEISVLDADGAVLDTLTATGTTADTVTIATTAVVAASQVEGVAVLVEGTVVTP